MTDAPDSELLAQFARDDSEAAFATLVERHLPLVYSVALRRLANPQQAQDIAQAVFILLARKAGTLSHKAVLPGWLYHTARLTAANVQRAEARRIRREQAAFMESSPPEPAPDAAWHELSPSLDEAMAGLRTTDRDALVLRYFQNKSLAEVGAALGLEERAAQKRVSRALEKLRLFFGRRGIACSAATIAGAVSANSVRGVPAGLAAAIIKAAFSGTALTTAVTVAALQTMSMTTLQKTAVAVALAITVGTGAFQARQNSQLRARFQAVQQQQAPMAAEIQALQKERDDATNRLAALAAEIARNKSDQLELLRLRGMAGVARQAVGEAERLRARLAQPAGAGQPSGTNLLMGAMMDSMLKAMEQQVVDHLARMTASLNLTPDQTLAVSNILMRQGRIVSAGMQQAFSGKFDKADLVKQAVANGDPETQIKALLTPAQLAAYPACQQAESAHTASTAANTELLQLQTTLGLAPDQLDSVYAALYNVNLNEMTGQQKPPPSTNTADVFVWLSDQKTQALEPVLTAAQFDKYRQQQADQAKLTRDLMNKMEGPGQ